MDSSVPRHPFLNLAALTASVQGDIDAAIGRVVGHHKFINGPERGGFERAWAGYCGVAEAAGTSSGTSALTALLRCDGIGRGDEVILPSHTFIATAESVLEAGATPVFADIDPGTMLLDAGAVEAVVTPRTAAVVGVHLYGCPVEWDALDRVAGRSGLALYEDAAQAHGAEWKGRRAGSLGRGAAFSFFPGKNLGAFGDAGAITTDDLELAAKCRAFVNHGRQSKFAHDFVGTNARLDTIQAAVLLAKLPHLDGWNARRREVAREYASALGTEEFASRGVRMQRIPEGALSSFHLFVVRVPGDREAVRQALRARGVETGVHYPLPTHLQPAMEPWSGGEGSLPETERAAGEIISLPMCPMMKPGDAADVCAILGEVLDATT